jgi:AraC-like DNA-binding protein
MGIPPERNLKRSMGGRIGKTRQAEIEEVFDPEVGPARGMVRRILPAGTMRHARRVPPHDLSPWVAHFWMIRWDLRGCDPQLVENLPHPNVHVIFEPDRAVVSGVQTKKFSRVLDGQSLVFGIKFRPGGFRPFFRKAVSALADRTIPCGRVFGKEVEALQAILVSSAKEDVKLKAASAFLRDRMPDADKTVALADELVVCILKESDIKTVDDLVVRAGIGKRSLQRIFNEYVGVSPKWVIRRYRLHEVMERLNSGARPDWAQVALELGYFDQAHLINDFRSILGYSPTQYQKLVGKPS